MIVSTLETPPIGYKIAENLDIMQYQCVRCLDKGLIERIVMRNDNHVSTIEEASEGLIKMANKVGANAVLGVKVSIAVHGVYQYSTFLATAVILEKIEE